MPYKYYPAKATTKPKAAKPKPPRRALLGVHPLASDGWSCVGNARQQDGTYWRVYTRPSLSVTGSPWVSVRVACESEAEPAGNYSTAWDGSRLPYGLREDTFRTERPNLVAAVIRILGGDPAAAFSAAAVAKLAAAEIKAEIIARAMADEDGGE